MENKNKKTQERVILIKKECDLLMAQINKLHREAMYLIEDGKKNKEKDRLESLRKVIRKKI